VSITSDATTPATDPDWEDVDDVPSTLLDREELVGAYWAVVAPAMKPTVSIPSSRRTAGSGTTNSAPFHTCCGSITT